MWDQLPELILTQIFSHLGRGDRANVAQVCQSWNRALSSPVLWRSVTVLVDRDLRGDFPLAGELAVRNIYDNKKMLTVPLFVNYEIYQDRRRTQNSWRLAFGLNSEQFFSLGASEDSESKIELDAELISDYVKSSSNYLNRKIVCRAFEINLARIWRSLAFRENSLNISHASQLLGK